MRFQAGLGRVIQDSTIYRKDTQMFEIVLAKVTKVNHEAGTCDVITMDGDIITGNLDEGGGGVRITQSASGYDSSTGAYWGQVRPIAIGTMVVIGFIDGIKNNPILLGVLPNSNYNFNSASPLTENKAGWNRMEALKTLDVHPDMSYTKIDGEGNREITFANKSFFKTFNQTVDPDDTFTDAHLNYDFNDLTELDGEGEVLTTKFEESKTPNKMLFVHRTAFNDDETTWTKFYLGMDGLFRLTRDNNDNTLSFMEYAKDGTFKIKRILNTAYDDDGATEYSQFMIDKNGEIILTKTNGEQTAYMGIGQDNVAYLESGDGSYIRVGDTIELEATNGIVSESLQNFIRKHHIIVSATEPNMPEDRLVWVDTSGDELNDSASESVNLTVEDFEVVMERVNAQIEELMKATSNSVTDKDVDNIINNTLNNSTYTTINDVTNIINNKGSDVSEFTIDDINIFWNEAKAES